MAGHLFRYTSEEEVGQTCPAMGAHYDKVDVVLPGVAQYFVSRSPLNRYRLAGYALCFKIVLNL